MSSSKSAVTIDASLFDPASISPSVLAFNKKLGALTVAGPPWWEVGAAEYRTLRATGRTAFPAPTLLPSARPFTIPSRTPSRTIPCVSFHPANTSTTPSSIFLHIHGGGWVLGSERSQDVQLQGLADRSNVVVVSVGYRLAPEDPWPAGPEDCYDAVEWVVREGVKTLGTAGGLAYIGGESAGAHLSSLCLLHLLQHTDEGMRKAGEGLKGVVLHYGAFDLTYSPQTFNFVQDPPVILGKQHCDKFAEAFLPNMAYAERKRADVSPLYADWMALRGRLPRALFTCGTEDVLLDETMFMSTKYMMAGGKAEVVIVPGAFHGFSIMEGVEGAQAEVAVEAVRKFMEEGQS